MTDAIIRAKAVGAKSIVYPSSIRGYWQQYSFVDQANPDTKPVGLSIPSTCATNYHHANTLAVEGGATAPAVISVMQGTVLHVRGRMQAASNFTCTIIGWGIEDADRNYQAGDRIAEDVVTATNGSRDGAGAAGEYITDIVSGGIDIRFRGFIHIFVTAISAGTDGVFDWAVD